MANWESIIAAQGYLLDVSTNDSFSDYVDGYHDLDVGNVKGRVVTGLNSGTTYYYRVRAYTSSGPGSYSETMPATTVPTTGLNIHATFDSSITGNPNAAAIEAMINQAISIYESLFRDPIHNRDSLPLRNDCAKWHSFAAGSCFAKSHRRLHGSLEPLHQ